MRPSMRLQSETILASDLSHNIAHIQFFSCVSKLMNRQMATSTKRLITDITYIQFIVRMGHRRFIKLAF